jgi:aldehyde dehydrogenase (NAD+)
MPRHWQYDLFIDGKWTTGQASSAIEVIDPATEEVIGQVPEATRADAVRAIQAARKAFDEGPWPWMKPRERAAVLVKMAESLERRAAELRELVVAQTGSVGHITDAFQAGGATGMFRSNAEQIVHSVDWVEANPPTGTPTGIAGSAIIREPVGVVAAITPFNFPYMLNVVKTAPAIAAGCTVVLKPHPWTPLDAFLIAQAAEEASLPPGVLNVIPGGAEVGEELSASPLVDMVTFTGSTATGRRIMASAAATVKKLQLELGGKSAQIVLDDVPEAVVANLGFGGVLTHCGQGCALPTRLVLPEKYLDAYQAGVKKAREKVVIGDPREKTTTLGPLIREQQRQRVEGYTQSAIEEGAEILTGGRRPDGLAKGFFYEPTIYLGDNSMRVAREEIFGPCLTVIPYSGDEAEAVRIANDSPYGLAGYVMSASQSRAFNVGRRIRAGAVQAISIPTSAPVKTGPGDGQGPGWGTSPAGLGQQGAFGGYKQSGIGREWGKLGVEEFCEIKSLSWR